MVNISAPALVEPASAAPAGPAKAQWQTLPRQGLERLDLLLLCVEALDLNGGETLLWMGHQLGFASLFPNRVALWKLRSHNPLRRACRRGTPEGAETEALIQILCAMADRVYPLVRGLLSSREPAEVNRQHWQLFEERLRELLKERMNTRRSSVQSLMDPQAGADQRRSLIQTLALAAGPGGVDRLRASLMDPNP
ncbi:MAG: DUF3038 domain-containing protein [Cyanobacteriota bacterium]|nr:DUF3038 domain-containing protein [Cyanobacteriota bacterium]